MIVFTLRHTPAFTTLVCVAFLASSTGCVGGSSNPPPGGGGFDSGAVFVADTADTAANVADTATGADAGLIADTTVADIGSLSDATATAADAGPDGPSCTFGSTRCSDGARQICALSGWKANPCEAITPACVEGKCLACTPKAKFCADKPANASASNKVMLCDDTGSAAKVSQHCPTGPCIDGACFVCFAGEHRCHNGQREVCAGGGLLWAPNHCPASKPKCAGGECLVCLPNGKSCGKDGGGKDAVVQCDATGVKGTIIEVCKAPNFCSDGACVACKPGAAQCKDARLATCKPDGTGFTITNCPLAAPACFAGACKLCQPSTVYCRAATESAPAAVMTCGAKGDTASAIKACNPGDVCHQKACKACAPGSAVCVGNAPIFCASNGVTVALEKTCSDKGLVCDKTGCGCDAGKPFCSAPAPGLAVGTSVWVCGKFGKVASNIINCKQGQSCVDGKCLACKPGDKRCGGNKALFCKADGSGWQVDTDCATKSLTCVSGHCEDLCALTEGNKTNLGCRFWAVDLDNAKLAGTGSNLDAQNAPYGLVLVNDSTKSASVTVTFGPGPNVPVAKTHKLTVAAGAATSVVLPPPSWGLKPASLDNTSLQGLAFRVDSTAPIAAFQHNPLQANAFSADASMLLPANGLGTKHRIVVRKQSLANLRAYFAVVATRPGTTKIKLTTTATTLAGGAVPALVPGKMHEIAVQQGQVLNVETAKVGDDLTGTLVESDKPVAVFAGAEAAHAPDTDLCVVSSAGSKTCAGTTKACLLDGDCPQTCCADHLEEQLPPIADWGTTHIAGRLQARGNEPDTWRIVAAHNGTRVAIRPSVTTLKTLQAGQWFEVIANKDLVIESTKPVLVAQFMASSGLTGKSLGDPALIVVPPVASMGREAHFWAPSTYTQSYVTVTTPVGATIALDVKTQVIGTPIAKTGWSAARLAVSAGKHVISCSEVCGGILHGWTKDGSYAHGVGFGAH